MKSLHSITHCWADINRLQLRTHLLLGRMRHRIRHDQPLQLAPIQRLHRLAAQDPMRHQRNRLHRPVLQTHVRRLAQRPARIRHVVHDDRHPALHIAHQHHAADLVRAGALLVDEREAEIEPIRHRRRALRPARVRAHDDAVGDGQVVADPAERAGLGVQVVDGDVEEALDLAGVQVHGDDVVAARRLQHVGHQLRRDRSPGLVLLVLAGVGEVGDDGGDASRRGRLAGVDHDEELHQAVVDVARGGGLEDEYCT